MTRHLRTIALALTVITAAVIGTTVATARRDYAADDIGTLALDVWDEFLIARGVQSMIDHHDWNYRVPVYPAFYPYVAKAFVKLGSASEHETVTTLRWMSWLFWVLSIVAVALLSRRTHASSLLGPLVAVFLVTLSSELAMWGALIHPETLIMLEMTVSLGLVVLASQRDDAAGRRLLWAATAVAGIAAGTKLVGLFVGPAVLLVELHWAARRRPESLLRAVLRPLLVHLALFVVTFHVTSPPAAMHAVSFWKGIRRQIGDNFTEAGSLADWPAAAAQGCGLLVTLVGCSMALWTLGRAAVTWRREGGRAVLEASPDTLRDLCLSAYILCFSLYLAAGVRIVLPRYAMPLLPALVWLAVSALERLLAQRALVIATALVTAAVPLAHDVGALNDLVGHWSFTEMNDPRMATRDWLRDTIRPGATVIYDAGAYMPYGRKSEHSWGLLRSRIARRRPEFVVTWPRRRERFRVDPAPLPQNKAQKQAHESYETYLLLERGELPGYEHMATLSDGTTVYRQAAVDENRGHQPISK